MKVPSRKIYLALVLLASILWQPSHHLIMGQGMQMNFVIHALVTMIPFLSFLLVLSKAEWSQ